MTATEYLAELRQLVKDNPSMLRAAPLGKDEAERELRRLWRIEIVEDK